MSKQLILIDTDLSVDGFKSVCPMGAGPAEGLQSLENYLVGLEGGNYSADVIANVGVVAASGTVTVASTGPTNLQTMSIAGYTLTAVTSGAEPTLGQFNISATPATVATGLAAAINGLAGLKALVSAVAVDAVVTVSSRSLGTPGNGIKMANVNLANTTVSGSGTLSGGSDGTEYDLSSK